MCTRYVFTDPAEAIRDLFSITTPLPNWPPSYNVAPTHIMPVIRPIDGGREIAMMEWGLVPFFSKDGKHSLRRRPRSQGGDRRVDCLLQCPAPASGAGRPDADGGLARGCVRRPRRGCGYDASRAEKLGQRCRVAHIPTAATAAGFDCVMDSRERNGRASN
jgi:hypothetical protein